MIDMPVSNKHRINLAKQITAIPEQVNAWLSCVDQEMKSLNQQETA
jgi:hypothetical protein